MPDKINHINKEIEELKNEGISTKDISDGYHTFQELYEQALTKTIKLITLTEKYLKNQITKKELLAHIGNNSYVTGIDCNKIQTMKYFKF